MSHKKLKIGVDVDDILIPFNQGFIKFVNQKLGTKLKFSAIFSFNLEEVLGKSKAEVNQLIDEYSFSEFLSGQDPILNSVEVICDLNNNQCELYSITARPTYLEAQTKSWLNKHFSDNFQAVYHLGPSDPAGERHADKGTLAKDLNLDIFIEDSLRNAINIAEQDISVLLLDKPWNQAVELPKNVHRVHDWPEIALEIAKFREGEL